MKQEDGSPAHAPTPLRGHTEPGPVMIIGGAEDKLRNKTILTRFVSLAGGDAGHIVVISTASSLGDEATGIYRLLFTQMGASRVSGLGPLTRRDANAPEDTAILKDATGVFLTGGNQLRLSSVVAGTKLGDAILAARARGAVVGGTSAGASAVSTHMMAFGSSGSIPKHRMAQVSAGLGLLESVVVDQHFEQRGRLGRLISVVAQSPQLLGLGIDEDTAAIVYPDQSMEVIGRGVVTIVDGSDLVTDAYVTKGHRPMMVSGAILHSLPAGYRFDLRERVLLPVIDVSSMRSVRAKEVAAKRMARMAKDLAAEGADSFVIERRGRARHAHREASE